VDRLKIVFVGIGGYGNVYLKEMLERMDEQYLEIAGVVDPYPEGCHYYTELMERNVPVYKSLEQFYAKGGADLAVISSPIHLHAEQTCYALSQGSHVLCEKPAAATIQQVNEMRAARDKYGKLVAIGYQWAFAPVIHELKADIAQGKYGKPLRMKAIILRPRNWSYFRRNRWAGKLKDEVSDMWVLDSVANNANAHFLHIMFFLLGETYNSSAMPSSVCAELYKANDIENFDTAFIRADTDQGVELLFYTSHAVAKEQTLLCFELEDAIVEYDVQDGHLRATYRDGRTKDYGELIARLSDKWDAVIRAVRDGGGIACGLEGAMSQTICINGAQESMPVIRYFPKELLVHDQELQLTRVQGLEEVLVHCFTSNTLPHESGYEWSTQGKEVDVTAYEYFKGGTGS
jgi:predicted dehydrogenase